MSSSFERECYCGRKKLGISEHPLWCLEMSEAPRYPLYPRAERRQLRHVCRCGRKKLGISEHPQWCLENFE
jgi:hypothetical protein